MKTKKESITARLRYYGSESTKKSDDWQVQLEIRNYTPAPIRISAKKPDGSLMHLKPNQMKLGRVIGRSDANIVNAYLTRIKERCAYVMQFLQYFNIPMTKKTIEEYLYIKFSDVYEFFTNVTDGEDAREYIRYMTEPEKVQQEELERREWEKTFPDYKATGMLDALRLHKFENVDRNRLDANIQEWCKTFKNTDYPIAKFDKVAFDKFIRFVISKPLKKGKDKDGKPKHYSVKSVDNIYKEVRIFLNELKKNDYEINPTALDFTMVKGNRSNAHIKYVNDEKQNVFSITKEELEAIKAAMNNKKLSEDLRKAATLFTVQTLLGGLRISELNSINKQSFIQVNDKITCYVQTRKTAKMIDSPLHKDLQPILESVKYDLNKLKFSSNEVTNNHLYNKHLKELAEKIGLTREIVQLDARSNANKQTIGIHRLCDILTNKLARKALITLLYYEGYTIEQIVTITKHSLTAVQFYLAQLQDVKRKMINTL